MPKIKVKGQTVQPGERTQTDKRTDGRYQVHYLPALRSIKTGKHDETQVKSCLFQREEMERSSGETRPGLQ